MATVNIDIQGEIATLVLNNPDKLNAIDLAMWQLLAENMAKIGTDRSIRCVVIRGAGDEAFAAGGDLEEFVTARTTLDQALHYHDQVAAALNARKRARYGVSPWFAPTALLLMAAGIVGVGAVTRGRNMFSREETGRFLLAIGLGVVPIVAYFATLSAYRKTARAIGASTQGWTVVIVVPWAMLAVNVLSQFFVNAIGESFIQVLGLVNMAVMGVQVLALYLALSSFDRACIGRHMGRDESNDLPDFLRPYA